MRVHVAASVYTWRVCAALNASSSTSGAEGRKGGESMLPTIGKGEGTSTFTEQTGAAAASSHHHGTTHGCGAAPFLHGIESGDDTGASSMLPPINAGSQHTYNPGGVSTLKIDSKSLMHGKVHPKPKHKLAPKKAAAKPPPKKKTVAKKDDSSDSDDHQDEDEADMSDDIAKSGASNDVVGTNDVDDTDNTNTMVEPVVLSEPSDPVQPVLRRSRRLAQKRLQKQAVLLDVVDAFMQQRLDRRKLE